LTIQEFERDFGDSMQSPKIEKLRYQSAMELEDIMLDIREDLRKTLVVKTTLKPEEVGT